MKAIAIVLIWWFTLYHSVKMLSDRKCPRELAGFSCRGEGCDHSDECMEKTKQMIKERRQ